MALDRTVYVREQCGLDEYDAIAAGQTEKKKVNIICPFL